MAKTLAERITSARTSTRVRITDLEALIAEAEAERDRLGTAATAANAESVDFALSDEDRDEAAAKAERHSRTARGIELALTALRAKLVDLRESDSRQASEAEKVAAEAERQELADRFTAFMPGAVEQMAELFEAIAANKERCARAGAGNRCAEAVARGVDGFLGYAGTPQRYADMKIPAWEGAGRAWPRPTPTPAWVINEAKLREEHKQREDKERARWKRYLVVPPNTGVMVQVETDKGTQGVYQQPRIYRMTTEQVRAAEAKGCKIREAREGEFIGGPAGVAAL